MTVAVTGTPSASERLLEALDAPRRPGAPLGAWRWRVRQQMAAVRDQLAAELEIPGEGWLAARERTVARERAALLARLSELAPQVLEAPDVERVRTQLGRLLVDIGHHLQRVRDLAYDDVEIELGGSE